MDAELEFAIQPSTTGKQLFDQVCFELSWLWQLINTHDNSYSTEHDICERNGLSCFFFFSILFNFADCQDNWAERDLVLWAPVPGQQGILNVAQTHKEGLCLHAVTVGLIACHVTIHQPCSQLATASVTCMTVVGDCFSLVLHCELWNVFCCN